MKKNIIIFMIFVFIFSLLACGENEKDEMNNDNVSNNQEMNNPNNLDNDENESSPENENNSNESKRITISSETFNEGENIPLKCAFYKVDGGENISPQLSWTSIDNANYYHIVMYDESVPEYFGADASFVHWIALNIPSEITSIEENIDFSSENIIQPITDAGQNGYAGPFPPASHGVHTYVFKIIASTEPIENISSEQQISLNEISTIFDEIKIADGKLRGKFDR